MTPETFLQMVEQMSGLLLEREQGIYSFAHLTIQEYLASVHIREQGLEATLLLHLGESWWEETTRLYCAQTDATRIIEACLKYETHSVVHLNLAIECQEESLKIQPKTKLRLDQVLAQGAEDANPTRRSIVAEALLRRRLKEIVLIKEGVYYDISPITCIEYQLFLEEKKRDCQPDHWKSKSFHKGDAHTPILGIRSSDASAFCRWLTERYGSTWQYQLPITEDIEELDKLMMSNDERIGYWVDNEKPFVRLQREPIALFQRNEYFFPNYMLDVDQATQLANSPVLTRIGYIELFLSSILNRSAPIGERLNKIAEMKVKLLESIRTHAYILDPKHSLADALEKLLGSNQNINTDKILELTHDLEQKRKYAFLDFLRIFEVSFEVIDTAANKEYILVRMFLPLLRRLSRWRQKRQDATSVLSKLVKIYLTLYFLQGRLENTLPPCEGIVVTKKKY